MENFDWESVKEEIRIKSWEETKEQLELQRQEEVIEDTLSSVGLCLNEEYHGA